MRNPILILTAVLLWLGTWAAEAQNYSFSTLTNFNTASGYFPYGALTLAGNGAFFGTAYKAGTNGSGSLFKVTTTGALASLYSFSAEVGSAFTNDTGASPYAGLTLGNDGNLYGVATFGGTNGFGSIFVSNTNGGVAPLFTFGATLANGSFAATNVIGANPQGKLALGVDGNLYGTTYDGGAYGVGTIFKTTTNGTLSLLATFNSANGANPKAGLTAGNDGNFYGVTYYGGNGFGTFFSVTTNGTLTLLHTFSLGGVMNSPNGILITNADGFNPASPLTLSNDGFFYGTALGGGTNGYGTIYRAATNGSVSALFSFNNTNGSSPQSELTLAPDGSFYGVTAQGGTNETGTIFRITTNGLFSSLFSFAPLASNLSGVSTNATGAYPYAALALGSDGNFYGTTTAGGVAGNGTIYKFSITQLEPLHLQLVSTNLVLTWTNAADNLQSAPAITGSFNTIPGATSPYTNPATGSGTYFRLIGN